MTTTSSDHLFAQVSAEFADRNVGLAHIGLPEYDELERNPHLARYRLDVIYDGALDEDTQFLVTPPDTDVIQRLVALVALEVATDYHQNPTASLGWSVEVYEVNEDGDTIPEGASPIMAHRHG